MPLRTEQANRGQALVEAVLGILVFITIFMVGIHFAEVGFLSLKVQEAANAAIWKVPTAKLHDTLANDWSLWKQGVQPAEISTQADYVDFDALSQGSTTWTQVFTGIDSMKVTCNEVQDGIVPAFNTPLFQSDNAGGATLPSPYPDGQAAASCQAQAHLWSLRIPNTFLDGQPFSAPHWVNKDIQVCATGRPLQGSCPVGLSIPLDDWAFSVPAEAGQCELAWEGGRTCTNQPYWDFANAYYRKPGTAGAASKLAQVVAGYSPIDENWFYMSFRGNESEFGPYTESVQVSNGDVFWETTTWKMPGWAYNPLRTNCWLGLNCVPQ